MAFSNIDLARGGAAPLITRCAILGEGDTVRLAFLKGEGDQTVLLSAVTLTRSQLVGFAGMVAAILNADDLNATSVK